MDETGGHMVSEINQIQREKSLHDLTYAGIFSTKIKCTVAESRMINEGQGSRGKG